MLCRVCICCICRTVSPRTGVKGLDLVVCRFKGVLSIPIVSLVTIRCPLHTDRHKFNGWPRICTLGYVSQRTLYMYLKVGCFFRDTVRVRRFGEIASFFFCLSLAFCPAPPALNLALLREALGRNADGSPSQVSETAMTSMVSCEYKHTCGFRTRLAEISEIVSSLL